MTDAQAADTLQHERYESTLHALYQAAARGLPEEELRILCHETGIAYVDLDTYVPPILRPRERGNGPTLALF